MLFDTHTHLDQPKFDEARAELIQNAAAVGVTRMVAVGCTATSSRRCVELAGEYEGVFAAVGIHPNDAAESAPEDWTIIEQLATAPKVVAIGETGLDRHWDDTPFEQQLEFFDRHIRLAAKHDLPFVVHMRDCEADMMQVLRDAYQRGPLKGIMHSFTGDAEMASECMAMGMHISFAGMVTFKKSEALRECAAKVADERLLVETDCPYLSPEPVRGNRPNEPANVRHTAECLARVRGTSFEELAALTTANANKLFGISVD
ncbi:MAG: TatD family hydrolase [Planctomycetota bacterium]